MINNSINELSVWADSLEDSNIDVSILRLLSEYNYLPMVLAFGYLSFYYFDGFNIYVQATGNGAGFGLGLGIGHFNNSNNKAINIGNGSEYIGRCNRSFHSDGDDFQYQ